jgi:hypothetical protein
MPDDSDRPGADSIEDLAEKRRRRWRGPDSGVPTQLSLEVRHRPELSERDAFISGSVKLAGDLPVRKDLHAGNRLTVSVADADGTVIASGVFEVGLPNFKDIKAKGAGIIGVERVHKAKFMEEE